LSASIEAYGEARYPDAADGLRSVEERRLDPDDRARFELFAGLNHLALGNLDPAVRHLSRARTLLEETPTVLNADDQARLFSAWRALGRSPGQPLQSPSAPGTLRSAPAIAASSAVASPSRSPGSVRTLH
jgi:hypothetical protein